MGVIRLFFLPKKWHRHTYKHMDRHRDIETESAQWANSVKSKLKVCFQGRQRPWHIFPWLQERLKAFWILHISEYRIKPIRDDGNFKGAVRNIKNSQSTSKRSKGWFSMEMTVLTHSFQCYKSVMVFSHVRVPNQTNQRPWGLHNLEKTALILLSPLKVTVLAVFNVPDDSFKVLIVSYLKIIFVIFTLFFFIFFIKALI